MIECTFYNLYLLYWTGKTLREGTHTTSDLKLCKSVGIIQTQSLSASFHKQSIRSEWFSRIWLTLLILEIQHAEPRWYLPIWQCAIFCNMCHICNSFIAATTSVTRNVNLACSWFSTNSCQSCEADKSIIKRKGSKNYPKIPLSWTRYFFFSCHCRWNVGFMSHFWIFPRKSWVWSFCLDSTECLSHTLCNASLVELPADQGQAHRTLALSEETEETKP